MLLITCIPSNLNLHDQITQLNYFELKAGFQCKRIFYDWKGAVERTAMLEVKITSKSMLRSLHTKSKNNFFSYSPSFPIKIHATDAKTFFLTDESFRGSVQTLGRREVV